jgi:hypothetical protein
VVSASQPGRILQRRSPLSLSRPLDHHILSAASDQAGQPCPSCDRHPTGTGLFVRIRGSSERPLFAQTHVLFVGTVLAHWRMRSPLSSTPIQVMIRGTIRILDKLVFVSASASKTGHGLAQVWASDRSCQTGLEVCQEMRSL